MPRKSSNAKSRASMLKKINNADQLDEISDAMCPIIGENPNPIKRQIKVHQLPWTKKQKDFLDISQVTQLKKVLKIICIF